MPVESFEVIVGVGTEMRTPNERTAIADASQYLAYADQTDTFGYHGSVWSVEVYGDGREQEWAVSLTFDAVIENDDALKAFMDEMVNLSRVESVEQVQASSV